jgi:hypothetical protein
VSLEQNVITAKEIAMKHKNNFQFYLLVLLATLFALTIYNTNAAKAAGTEAASVKQGDQKINWLFVVTSTSGSFDGKTLTLQNVPPTLMFSDRPNRFFGHMDTAKLIKEVNTGPDNFAVNPPNAVLSTFGGGLPTTGTVILHGATLTGKTLSFFVKVLEGNIPDKFEGATLFIDPFHHHNVGAFVVGSAVGRSRAQEETETVVVQEPTYYYQGTPAPDKPSTKSPESKLQELKSMYDKGLITKSEYEQKRKEILDQM